jgi:hypothetical protein
MVTVPGNEKCPVKNVKYSMKYPPCIVVGMFISPPPGREEVGRGAGTWTILHGRWTIDH